MRSWTKQKSLFDKGRFTTLLSVALLCGCNGQDADHMARIGRKTMARCDELTVNLRSQAAAGIDSLRANWPTSEHTRSTPPAPARVPSSTTTPAPAAVANTLIDARVLWRIRWDKSLAGADIEVSSPSGGVVHLRGIVNDLERQRRAIELAETTEGVERVVNELGLKQN